MIDLHVDKARITASFSVGTRDGYVFETRVPAYIETTAPVYHLTTGELLPVEVRGVLAARWR